MPQAILPKVLLVEDNTANAMLYDSYLNKNYEVIMAASGHTALSIYEHEQLDLIILDIQLPDINGLELLKTIRRDNSNIPIVIITAHGSVDIALDAIKYGANDFLSKPFDKARLLVTLDNQLKGQQLSQIISSYEQSCSRESYYKMIGGSLVMQSVYNIIASAATSKATVFITGESGTGKELCAEAIHQASDRKKHNFIAINCAAIPHDLLESEIFGHVKGAFTGASQSREGAAVAAHQGTLFLDEIGEMPIGIQSKLLRFIQTGCFQPVGSNKELSMDIRFVCATNRDPLEEVKAGRFREDLYYRLHVIPIYMPPLRERKQDVLSIANAFLATANKDENKNFVGFSQEINQLFLNYEWPGNVRELGNVVRNMVVLHSGETVTMDMLPTTFGKGYIAAEPTSSPQQDTTKLQIQPASDTNSINIIDNQIDPLWLAEKKYIEATINLCKGNVPKAAAVLEVSPSTIYRKKQQWSEKLA